MVVIGILYPAINDVLNGNNITQVQVIGNNVEYEDLAPLSELKSNQNSGAEYNDIVSLVLDASTSGAITTLGYTLDNMSTLSSSNVITLLPANTDSAIFTAGDIESFTNVKPTNYKKDFWEDYKEQIK